MHVTKKCTEFERYYSELTIIVKISLSLKKFRHFQEKIVRICVDHESTRFSCCLIILKVWPVSAFYLNLDKIDDFKASKF